MIEYIKGDLFKDYHPIIAHGCNSLGVMGSGFAKQVKAKFPDVYRQYALWFVDNKLSLGVIQIVPTKDPLDGRDMYITNCITQQGYGLSIQHVDYDAVNQCMEGLATHLKWATKLRPKFWTHIAMPKIGAGLGGGDWAVIEPIIKRHLDQFHVKVYEL